VKIVTEEFLNFVSSAPQLNNKDLRSALKDFLSATMDEVRLFHAGRCIRMILQETDHDDAEHFRIGVLRRELAGEISYPKQRDHSAHTLNNFLLGLYLFNNSPALANEFQRHSDMRGAGDGASTFVSIWEFASLLHDIGYLFEGSLATLSSALQTTQVARGAEIVQEYFSHRLWVEIQFDSVADREALLRLAGVERPDFSQASLSAVADGLRYLGSLENLRGAARDEAEKLIPSNKNHTRLSEDGGLPGDAFELWKTHYNAFGVSSMAERISGLAGYFEGLMTEGIGRTGLRVLDHGVCSGLLMLLYSTFYFKLHFGLSSARPTDSRMARIWDRFRERVSGYSALWWWQGVVWGTAAAAVHNAQQQKDFAKQYGALKLEEDPLAYLGILVDILQEWDRYSVSRESAVSGQIPLQGVDVKLGKRGKLVSIVVSDKNRAAKMIESLDAALFDWTRLIAVS
jgi:hypothetical protein